MLSTSVPVWVVICISKPGTICITFRSQVNLPGGRAGEVAAHGFPEPFFEDGEYCVLSRFFMLWGGKNAIQNLRLPKRKSLPGYKAAIR